MTKSDPPKCEIFFQKEDNNRNRKSVVKYSMTKIGFINDIGNMFKSVVNFWIDRVDQRTAIKF